MLLGGLDAKKGEHLKKLFFFPLEIMHAAFFGGGGVVLFTKFLLYLFFYFIFFAAELIL